MAGFRPGSHRLAVDIGNTETAIGVYAGSSTATDQVHLKTIRLPSDDHVTPDFLYSILLPHIEDLSFDAVVVSSVVPQLTAVWTELAECRMESRTIVLEPARIPGIEIRIARPEEAGVDRIVNSWMGFRRYGGPLVIVDMGTATTFDVVDHDGAYLGGVIAPGVRLLAESLARRTAKLPRIEIEPPATVVGRTTKEALQSGIVLGHTAMVEGLLNRIDKELGTRRVVATGGLMNSVRPDLESRFHAFDASLTLDGIIAISAEMGKGQG